MIDPVDQLLARLDNVKGKDGKWTAKCPAHDDRSPSLGIGVGDDGRVLIICRSGCGAVAVMVAVGLTASDMFRKDPLYYESRRKDRRPRPDYRALLYFLRPKMYVLSIAAKQLEDGKPFTEENWAALQEVIEHLERLPNVR